MNTADARAQYGAIIQALADLVNLPQTDKQCEDELLPRDPVMRKVVKIREAAGALLRAALAAAAPSPADHTVLLTEFLEIGREEWGHYPEKTNGRLWIAKCEQAIAAPGAQPAPTVQPVPESLAVLFKFYSVASGYELIEAQARHIERLQAKLPHGPSFASQQVRGVDHADRNLDRAWYRSRHRHRVLHLRDLELGRHSMSTKQPPMLNGLTASETAETTSQPKHPVGFNNRGDSTFEGGPGALRGEVPAEPSAELKRYEPVVMVEEGRGRTTASGAAMEEKPGGRWVRASGALATIARLETELAQARAAVPEGWKLVPVEPTREMMEAMPRMPPLRPNGLPFRDAGWSLNAITNRERWAAAIAAAPNPPAQPAVSDTAVRIVDDIDAALPATASSADARDGALTAAARDVLAERTRQIGVEGWTTDHDDEHQYGELSRAAGSYALFAASTLSSHPGVANSLHRSAAGAWPWNNPSKANACTERRNLIKAGALILAEIERLDRAAIATTQPKEP